MNKTHIAVIALAVFCLFVVSFSCGSGTKTTDNPKQEEDPGSLLFDGRAKADVNCASCHDASSGGTGPNLAESVGGLSDEEIMQIITQGRGDMPAFSDALAEQETKQLLSCLRARFGEKTQ